MGYYLNCLLDSCPCSSFFHEFVLAEIWEKRKGLKKSRITDTDESASEKSMCSVAATAPHHTPTKDRHFMNTTNPTTWVKRTNPPCGLPLSGPGVSLSPSWTLLKPLSCESDLSWGESSFSYFEEVEDEDELERERFFFFFLKEKKCICKIHLTCLQCRVD